MTRLALSLVAVLSFAVAACGDDGHGGHADAAAVDCRQETRADPYVAGMEALGSSGYKIVLVSSDPAPPAKGNNTWSVQLVGPAGSVDGATLDVSPFMPDHGHGTSIGAEVTPDGTGGMYMVDPVNLWMPGYWEVTIDIDDQGTTDSVVFKTCIDG